MRKAVDISSNNDRMDFAELKRNGVSVVFIKVTEGRTYVDHGWRDRLNQAKSAGLAVGLYHFARPDNGNSPEDEADHFWDTAVDAKSEVTEGWVLDIEVGSNVGPWSLRFLKNLEANLKPKLPEEEGIYFSPGWWEGAAGSSPQELSRYFAWEADYFNDRSPKHSPPIPKPWTEWRWFQYSDREHIGSYTGDADVGKEAPVGETHTAAKAGDLIRQSSSGRVYKAFPSHKEYVHTRALFTLLGYKDADIVPVGDDDARLALPER